MVLNLNNGIDNTSDEVREMLTEFMTEVDETLASFKSDITNQIATLKSDMTTQITAVKTDVNTTKTTLNSAITSKAIVKSVQRGRATPEGNSNTAIKINTVNPDKCLVLLEGTRTGSSYATTVPTLVSLTSTVLTVSPSGQSISGNYNVHEFSWQVIEFY